jgi:hypothetical protein
MGTVPWLKMKFGMALGLDPKLLSNDETGNNQEE